MEKSYGIDMCDGPLLGKILLFSVPLVMSGILQPLFNAMDIIVAEWFIGSSALATAGSASALINLLTNVFVGLFMSVNILVAKYHGGHREEDTSETVYIAITTSVLSRLFLVALGLVIAKPLLHLMGTPDDMLSQSVLYMRIYFLGMPMLMLYNFGTAILRAIGDTRRSLYLPFTAGIVNVVLSLLFVISLSIGADGVAWTTAISEHISALPVLKSLMEAPRALKLSLRNLRTHPKKLKRIIRIGLPTRMQEAIFSISNVLTQSSVSSFSFITMMGSTASSNIEGFAYTVINAVYQANLNFTSQNLGGRKYSRINKIMYVCLGVVTGVGPSLGPTTVLGGKMLLGIYSSDPKVLRYGILGLGATCIAYFLRGITDCMMGSLRGLGYSIVPTFVSLIGACGFRVLRVFTVFAAYYPLNVLYLLYPIPWTITAVTHMTTFRKICRKAPKQDATPTIQMPTRDVGEK